MFDSIGWAEILVLVVAALFILGPERLPQAASWLGKNTRKLRELAGGAQRQLREEVGPEFDELRQPLQELKGLRNTDPKRAVTRHLFDDDDDPLGLRDDVASSGRSSGSDGSDGSNGSGSSEGSRRDMKPNGYPSASTRRQETLERGQTPPVDADAT